MTVFEDLIEYLHRQIDADEQVALGGLTSKAPFDGGWKFDSEGGSVLAYVPAPRIFEAGVLAHIGEFDPEHQLRQVAANRKLVARADELIGLNADGGYFELLEEYRIRVLPALAAMYVDRPGFLAEWRP